MTTVNLTIEKNPTLPLAQDFYRLRRLGLSHIESLCGQTWTDYNSHDPGITLLETWCYVITDISFRIHSDISDILCDNDGTYKDQTFFAAKDILTTHPTTIDDYRRWLLDLPKIRNAWLYNNAQECACEINSETYWYTGCDSQQTIVKGYQDSLISGMVKVGAIGLYDALVELEEDPVYGDLNSQRVEKQVSIELSDNSGMGLLQIDAYFPDLRLIAPTDFALLSQKSIQQVTCRFGATPSFDVFTDPSLVSADPANPNSKRNEYLVNYFNELWYLSLTIKFSDASLFVLPPIRVRLVGAGSLIRSISVKTLQDIFSDDSQWSLPSLYVEKNKKIIEALTQVKNRLSATRNLSEDFSRIDVVEVEHIAACADIQVDSGFDIEDIQAKIWLAIENYFSPSMQRFSLNELSVQGYSSESIFNGPCVNNGIVTQESLLSSQIKTQLNTSDIIHDLMEIEGILAVDNLLLRAYNDKGELLVDDSGNSAAPWTLVLLPNHQPRLYRHLSRFLFYKQDLPFIARQDEAEALFAQRKGEQLAHNKLTGDWAYPNGNRIGFHYYPAQFHLPITYGIGPDGLPASADKKRKAQAKQLQGYLLPAEQLLANIEVQRDKVAQLFSINPNITQTYPVADLSKTPLHVKAELAPAATTSVLANIRESSEVFLTRRNQFLDHLLARFGESFSHYALLLSDTYGRTLAQEQLILSKINFLKNYPELSKNRAHGFDHSSTSAIEAYINGNNPTTLTKRVNSLLGVAAYQLVLSPITHLVGNDYRVTVKLTNELAQLVFTGKFTIAAHTLREAGRKGRVWILQQLSRVANFRIKKVSGQYAVSLYDETNKKIGALSESFQTRALGVRQIARLLNWASHERSFVIEHLLLRPKFIGDALMPSSYTETCDLCTQADPYSFQLTYVMPGWAEPYSNNLTMREFANRTLLEEMPSHLLAKVCWVGNQGLDENECNGLVDRLVDCLQDAMNITDEAACNLAKTIYQQTSEVFITWFIPQRLRIWHTTALKSAINTLLASTLNNFAAQLPSAELKNKVATTVVDYFTELGIRGWQFDRLENTWQEWLFANARLTLTGDTVFQQIYAHLENALVNPLMTAEQKNALNLLAHKIIQGYGQNFSVWISTQITQGKQLAQVNFASFVPNAIDLSGSLTFKPNTSLAVKQQLNGLYQTAVEASYQLQLLLTLMTQLYNIYPSARLHDCDDGSDINPVRLGATTLGSQTLREQLLLSELTSTKS